MLHGEAACDLGRVEITCRRAVPEDAPAIARAHVAAWQAAYRGLMPAHVLDGLDVAHSTVRWQQRLDAVDPNVFVAAIDGAVIGVCTIGPTRDTDAADQLAGHLIGEVQAINLHPRAWRRGAGGRLLALAEDMLREHGYTRAMLWVLERNASARAFYQARGWALDERATGRKIVSDIGGVDLPHVRYWVSLDESLRSSP